MKNTIRNTQYAILITLILVWLLPQTAQAATYYCDASQTGTNHAGTDVDPYSEADLSSKVLDVQWQPGDTIYCKGAFGNIVCADQTYGSAGGGYVTWAAWPGFTPEANFVDMPDNTTNVYLILDGWNFDRGWTDADPGHTIDLDDTSYIQIKNCAIQGGKNATLTGDFAPYFIVLDGNANACISDSSGSSDYITVENCVFSNTFTGVYVNGSHWTIKDSNFLSHIASDGIVLTSSTSDCVVQDCQFNDHNDYYGMWSWPGTATGTWTGHQYEGVTNDTSGHSGKFIEISSAGRLRIVADDASAKPIRGESTGSKWVLDSNNTVYFTVSGHGDSAHVDYVEVVGGNDGAEDIVERCWFGENLHGQFAKLEDNGDDPYIEFRNNVGWAYYSGAKLLFTSGSGGRINIYGNTLVNVDNFSAGVMINYMNKHVYNNIFSGGASWGTDPIYDTDADYNVWLEKPTSTFLQGEHDISPADVNAIFVDYAGRDFNLATGSPAIDSGFTDTNYYTSSDYTAVANVRTDNAPPDIGAYEYISSTPPPSILYGDVSGEGEISAYDAALTAQAVVDLITLSPEQITAAEVSGDGEVTAYDAALIAQRAVGLIDKFPVEN